MRVPENLFLAELDAHRHLTIVDQSGLRRLHRPSPLHDEVTTVTEFDDPGTQTATLEDFIPPMRSRIIPADE